MPVFEFQTNEAVERLLADGADSSADLADILIAESARALGCESGITFDKGAAKLPFLRTVERTRTTSRWWLRRFAPNHTGGVRPQGKTIGRKGTE